MASRAIVGGEPEPVGIARPSLEPPFQPDVEFLVRDVFESLLEFFGRLIQLVQQLTPIDAALSLALLDIEVAFEIVIFCLLRDFAERAQTKWDSAVLGPIKERAGCSKTNMGAGEVEPG